MPELKDSDYASGRPDFTAADFEILAAIDLQKPEPLHGSGPWEVAVSNRAEIEWIEPWNHSRAYLAGWCGRCKETLVFFEERPSHRPGADAFLADHGRYGDHEGMPQAQ